MCSPSSNFDKKCFPQGNIDMVAKSFFKCHNDVGFDTTVISIDSRREIVLVL